MAFDPARTGDNSILSAMNLYEEPELGLCGDIINCVNFIDVASKRKFKLDSNRQLQLIRNYLLAYNGSAPDYEFIDSLQIDQGAGGGGTSTYADQLLNDWTDIDGKTHCGLIDKDHELYAGYSKQYRNAVDKLRLVSPRKYRTQMVEEFIELFNLGVIRMPYEFNGQDVLRVPKIDPKTGEESSELYYLSDEEVVSLKQIDLMKNEITSIHKSMNAERTSVQYALAKEKANRVKDDRFYTIIMLAHRLYELRRSSSFRSIEKKRDISALLNVRAPKLHF